MADLDFDFSERKEAKGGPLQRRDGLGDKLGRLLHKVVDGAEVRPDVFTMSNAWDFFRQMKAQIPEGKKCMLSVKQMKGRYVITQILLDDYNEPIPQTTKAYWGRTVEALRLDPSVVDYLGNGTARIMEMPKL